MATLGDATQIGVISIGVMAPKEAKASRGGFIVSQYP
jgi:hypothetical protein